jgi:predicted TIM-barrel fold metal-dependent hydrolase
MNDRAPLFPSLPVIDSHHHLWHRPKPDAWSEQIPCMRFLLDDYLEYLGTEHRVVASVTVANMFGMFRASGPSDLRWVGETEFLNGQAAMAASGKYGPCLVGHGLIANLDFCIGERVEDVLEAHLAAAPQRLKGIRQPGQWDPDENVIGPGGPRPHLYLDPTFQAGVGRLEALGLSFDGLLFAPQISEFTALAQRFPQTQMILNHVGVPLGVGRHAGRRDEQFPHWRQDMADLAACENVAVKLGGLGTSVSAFPSFQLGTAATAEDLARDWRPYVDTTIELFGAGRCMFESNIPTDRSGSFDAVCGAFKLLAAECSDAERRSIFFETANTVYRLGIGDEVLAMVDADTAAAAN